MLRAVSCGVSIFLSVCYVEQELVHQTSHVWSRSLAL